MGTNSEEPGSSEGEAPKPKRPLRLIRRVEQEELDKKYPKSRGLRLIPGVEEALRKKEDGKKKDLRLIPPPGTDSTARYDPIPAPENEADRSARYLQEDREHYRDREARGDDR